MSIKLATENDQEIAIYLKERIQFFREENARMENIFRRLKISTDVEKATEIKEELCSMEANPDLLHAERLRKHNQYLSKLKICIKIYVNINERLSEDIKIAKRELDHSRDKVGGILNLSSEQIQQMEEKAKRYETEIRKFEQKYLWLKDPMFHLPNISEEVQKLSHLKDTKERLTKELSVFQGLKPDISEATQQLTNLKEELKKMSSVLRD